jgi:CrcB protein
MLILMVAAGGALGAVARYGLSGWVQSLLSTTFPLGTLVVNALGSLALGVVLVFFESLAVTAEVRALVTIGILGAFTTFSTFSYEAVVLLQGGEWARGGMYVGGSLLLGLFGILMGFGLGSLILQARG